MILITGVTRKKRQKNYMHTKSMSLDLGQQPEEPHFNSSEFRYDDYCTCDLTSLLCDPNCCCDPDCGTKEKLAFSGCRRVLPHNPDPKYCYSHDIVVKNNTQYPVDHVG